MAKVPHYGLNQNYPVIRTTIVQGCTIIHNRWFLLRGNMLQAVIANRLHVTDLHGHNMLRRAQDQTKSSP